MIKRILLIAIGILLLAQLAQPDRSVPAVDPANDMLKVTGAPTDIQQMVIGACYDCHSYRTEYPMWAYITPINFWIQDHINEGREKVNYSRWDLYAGNEEAAESGKSMAEGEMPPPNYARMHGHAQLTAAQNEQLIAWFNANIVGAAKEGGGQEGGTEEGEEED
ncbi:MAG: heme-binding domain-containing protein [Flavobacteriales bacterium]|nr:heme-binding domain-containing protein [Flavobacteriales bacterium]